jgi:hypothetical protein
MIYLHRGNDGVGVMNMNCKGRDCASGIYSGSDDGELHLLERMSINF